MYGSKCTHVAEELATILRFDLENLHMCARPPCIHAQRRIFEIEACVDF